MRFIGKVKNFIFFPLEFLGNIRSKTNGYLNKKNIWTKKYLIGASSSIAAQVIASVSSIIITGMLTRYFTPEEFGVWSLLVSLLGIFMGADLGFGNALKNKISQFYADGNEEDSRIYFLSTFYLLIFWAILLSAVIYIFKGYLPIEQIIKTKNIYLLNLSKNLIIIASIFYIINSAFKLFSQGFYAYQETHYRPPRKTLQFMV